LSGEGAGALGERSPAAVLQRSPEEHVEGPGLGLGRLQVMQSVGADQNAVGINGTLGGGAVVDLQRCTCVLVTDGESAQVDREALGPELPRVGCILHVHFKIGHSVQVEDALRGATTEQCEIVLPACPTEIRSIEAATDMGEGEISDQSVRDTFL